jgi:hypothetical protein
MVAANTYRIRVATDEDTFLLRRMVGRDSVEPPLRGPVLIGEIEGTPRAACRSATGVYSRIPPLSAATSWPTGASGLRACGPPGGHTIAARPDCWGVNPSSNADAVAAWASMACARG